MNTQNRVRTDFFDDVLFDSEETKQQITSWVNNLCETKNVTIDKFSYFFSKCKDIIFPIKISKRGLFSSTIIDDTKTQYYLWYLHSPQDYTIGKNELPYEKDYTFKITPETAEITLTEMRVIQLKKDDTYLDLSFSYDSKKGLTTAKLLREDNSIKFIYTSQDEEFDDQLTNSLFRVLKQRKYFYDVSSLLMHVEGILHAQFLSIISTRDVESFSNIVLSEIVIKKGIIKKYSFTEMISDFELCLHQDFIPQTVERFLDT